jgi:hypothetical protein
MASDYFIFFQALKYATPFSLNFFPVPQTTLQDCGKQHLPVFEVVLGVRMGLFHSWK